MIDKLNSVLNNTVTELVLVKQIVMERPIVYKEGITSLGRV